MVWHQFLLILFAENDTIYLHFKHSNSILVSMAFAKIIQCLKKEYEVGGAYALKEKIVLL